VEGEFGRRRNHDLKSDFAILGIIGALKHAMVDVIPLPLNFGRHE